MFVMSLIAQLVLGGVFCGNQSNCRICILIGECWNGVDSLEILELCRIAWKGWKVMNDWNAWNVSGVSGMSGRSCKTHGCISRRSPCLLCVEFLFWNEGPLPSVCSSSTRRALLSSTCRIGFWMENSLDCSVMCTCSIGAGIGAGIGAEEFCKTSSCRIAVLEVSVKTVMPLLRMHF